MTKQEAINRTRELLALLESLPDDGGIDIMNAEIRDSYGMSHTQIYLRSGIETVGKALGRHIKEEIPDGCAYVHRTINITLCDYVQLDSIYSTGDSPMVQEDAKEGIEPEYIVSWDGYDGCQRETRFKTREDAELEAADLREHTLFPESVSVTRWPDEPCR